MLKNKIILASVLLTLSTAFFSCFFVEKSRALDEGCYKSPYSLDGWREKAEEKESFIKELEVYVACSKRCDTARKPFDNFRQAYGEVPIGCPGGGLCCRKSVLEDMPTCNEQLHALSAQADAVCSTCVVPEDAIEGGPYGGTRTIWQAINTTAEEYLESQKNYLNNEILPTIAELEKTCHEIKGEKGDSLIVAIEPKSLLADGMEKAKITVTSLKDDKPLSGSTIALEAEKGELSSGGVATNSSGKAVVYYTAPAVASRSFGGESIKINISDGKNEKIETIEIMPAPFIWGKVVNIEGKRFPDAPVRYRCDYEGSSFTNDVVSNEQGEFFVPANERAVCKVFVGYKYGDYLYVRKENLKSPQYLGEIILATTREFEKDTTSRIIAMLIKSGIPKDQANAVVNGIVFDYGEGGPEFYIEEPTAVRELLGSPEWASLRMPSEQYWANAEWFTIFHEFGHVVMRGFAIDEEAEVGEDHDIWLKTNRDTAFDEARAHFFALLMLRESGRQSPTAGEFTDNTSLTAAESETVEGNRIEGVITTFFKKIYRRHIHVCPSCVFRDFMDIQNEFAKNKGRPPRTVEEWIDGQKMLRQGDEIYQIANDLKISHSGPIETGIAEGPKPSRLVFQVEKGGKVNIKDAGIGKTRMDWGRINLEEDDEIETLNSSGTIVYPDGSYIKLRPGSKAQVWEDESIIIRNGSAFIRIVKEKEGGFQIITPSSEQIVNLKSTTVAVSVSPDGQSVVKLIEGEVDISDLEENPLASLQSGEQFNSQTESKESFNVEDALNDWQEMTEEEFEQSLENQLEQEGEDEEKGEGGRSSAYLWFILAIGLLAAAGGIVFFVKKKKP